MDGPALAQAGPFPQLGLGSGQDGSRTGKELSPMSIVRKVTAVL